MCCKQGAGDYSPARNPRPPGLVHTARGRLRLSNTSTTTIFDENAGDTTCMFITPAYAQGAGGSSDFLVQLIPILLMFVIFYFLLIRPQQARVKQHQQMIANIRRGDTVVTGGGIVGTVSKVKDDGELEVEIARDIRIRVIKGTVSEVRVKGEPVKDA